MTDFNYQKGYCVLALPAFEAFNTKQKTAFDKIYNLVGDLNQDRKLNIPLSKEMETTLSELSDFEISTMSRASYFVGHWHPGVMAIPFDNTRGESWKVANVCDQILRIRLETPHNIQIHEGKLRVTFENKNCWLWDEFALATADNLNTFKTCKLPFGESTLDTSAKKLADSIGDLWANPDEMADNGTYLRFLKKTQAAKLKKLKNDHARSLEKIKGEIKHAEKKLAAFTWLVERGADIGNCIYYSHTDTFCFGWLTPLSVKEKDAIASILADFPYKWEFSKKY